jgi:hypothetical protein
MSEALLEAWTTAFLGPTETRTRLEALLEPRNPDFSASTPVESMGEVLRYERPERALEAAVLFSDELPWRQYATESMGSISTKPRGLTRLIRPLDVFELVDLARLVGRAAGKLDPSIPADLLRWLLAADEGALARLEERMASVPAGHRSRVRSIQSRGEVARRTYRLLAGTFDDPRDEVRWLAGAGGTYWLMTHGAADVAERLGITLESPGMTQAAGGVSASMVWHEDAKPLLELAHEMDPELFEEALVEIAACPSLGKHRIDWLASFAPWSDRADVAATTEFVRVRRFGRAVIVHRGKTGKEGGVTAKREKTEAAAKAAFEKKVSAAEGKLACTRVARIAIDRPADPRAALLEACRGCDRARARELVVAAPEVVRKAGAELLVAAKSDPAIFRELLDAGADPTARVDGASVMQIVARHYDPNSPQAIAILELLLARGVPPTGALAEAAAGGYAPLVSLLLAAGADPLEKGGFTEAPVDIAERRGHAAVVAMLRMAADGRLPDPSATFRVSPGSPPPPAAAGSSRAAATVDAFAAFATTMFDRDEVERRFRAVLDHAEPGWEAVRDARAVGAVLRVLAPDRVRAALAAFASLLDWDAVSQDRGGISEGPLSIVAHRIWQLGGQALTDIGFDDIVQLLRAADAPDADVGRAIFEYLELGDDAARDLLMSRLSGGEELDTHLGLASSEPVNARVYELLRALRADRLATPADEIAWALSNGSSNFHATAMTSLARRTGVDPPAMLHGWGHDDRKDVRAFATALRIDPEATAPLFATWCKGRYVDAGDLWLMSELDRVGADEEWEVTGRGPMSEHHRMKRLGSLVVSQAIDTRAGAPQAVEKLVARACASPGAASKALEKLVASAEKTSKARRSRPKTPEPTHEWLRFAVEAGDRELLRALLAAVGGALAQGGETEPLLVTATCPRRGSVDPDILRQLTRAGADPNSTDSDGDPALCRLVTRMASEREHSSLEPLRVLLEAGATPDARASDGTTALHAAASSGLAEAVALLLLHGAAPRLPTSESDASAIDLARAENELHVVALLSRQPRSTAANCA